MQSWRKNSEPINILDTRQFLVGRAISSWSIATMRNLPSQTTGAADTRRQIAPEQSAIHSRGSLIGLTLACGSQIHKASASSEVWRHLDNVGPIRGRLRPRPVFCVKLRDNNGAGVRRFGFWHDRFSRAETTFNEWIKFLRESWAYRLKDRPEFCPNLWTFRSLPVLVLAAAARRQASVAPPHIPPRDC
jgi:hypothetical protein